MARVESLKELNKIVQKTNYKKVGNWMVRKITRDMALPLTWILLHTPISANGVTFISLIVGMSGCVFLSFESNVYFLWGAILLQFWYLLDHVDGQIARYRNQSSVTGIFFDYITHHIIHIGVFVGIGWSVYTHTLEVVYILLGIITATGILVLNLIYDCQYKAFFHWIKMYSQLAIKKKVNTATSDIIQTESKSRFRMMFSWFHKLGEIHVLMNVITVIAIIQITMDLYLSHFVIVFYLVLISFTAVLKITYFVLTSKPDKEFRNFVNSKVFSK